MRMLCAGLVLLAVAPAAAAQAQTQTAPVIDNDRVTVWDVKLGLGESAPATPKDLDSVTLFLEGGTIRSTDAAGHSTIRTYRYGAALFAPRGTARTDRLVSGGPAHEILVALKDKPVPPAVNHSGYPPAFPRKHAVKALENDRVIVWSYSWSPGVATPMHYHDKDVVVVYRGEGTLDSVTPDGTHTPTAHHAGEIRFNKGDRTHYELLTQGQQSAIMMELK